MCQYRYATRLECAGAENGFLAGMRKNRQADGSVRNAFDRGNYFLTFAVGDSGIGYNDTVRADNECDIRNASAIFPRNLAAAS